MGSVRRLVCFLVLASLTLSLRASVPELKRPATLNRTTEVKFESSTQARPGLTITSAPANVSFYEEFYPSTSARQEQPKTSLLHWFGSLIKKAVRR
jgi:hypothetical protein